MDTAMAVIGMAVGAGIVLMLWLMLFLMVVLLFQEVLKWWRARP